MADEKFIKNKIGKFLLIKNYNKVDLFTDQEKLIGETDKKWTQDLFDRHIKIINIPIAVNDNLPPAYDVYLTNLL